jgi:hypothetical protein
MKSITLPLDESLPWSRMYAQVNRTCCTVVQASWPHGPLPVSLDVTVYDDLPSLDYAVLFGVYVLLLNPADCLAYSFTLREPRAFPQVLPIILYEKPPQDDGNNKNCSRYASEL